jgi:hypothetical protein
MGIIWDVSRVRLSAIWFVVVKDGMGLSNDGRGLLITKSLTDNYVKMESPGGIVDKY